MNGNFRALEKKNEIYEILKEAMAQKSPITLWQVKNDKRLRVTGLLVDVGFGQIHIQVTVPKGKTFSFDGRVSIYFHSQFHNVLYKEEIKTFSPDTIATKFPRKILLHERRAHERIFYKLRDFKFIFFSHLGPAGPGSKTFKGSVLDISAMGANFLVSGEHHDLFRINDTLYIHYLSDQKIPTGFQATLLHLRPFQGGPAGKGPLLSFGVRFLQSLQHIPFLPRGDHSPLIKNPKTAEEFFTGLTLEAQEKTLSNYQLKDRTSGLALRENLDFLQNLQFLLPPMKHLIFMGLPHDIIASALRVCTQEVIARFLEDIAQGLRQDILQLLKASKPIGIVMAAQDQLISFLRKKSRSGEIILRFDHFSGQ